MYQLICAAELFQKSFAGVFLQLHHSSNQECLAHGANSHFLKLKKNSNLLKKQKKFKFLFESFIQAFTNKTKTKTILFIFNKMRKTYFN